MPQPTLAPRASPILPRLIPTLLLPRLPSPSQAATAAPPKHRPPTGCSRSTLRPPAQHGLGEEKQERVSVSVSVRETAATS